MPMNAKMNNKKSFADKLAPDQIQEVLDALKLPWRDHIHSENDGWVNMPSKYFLSDLSVNIKHGGFVDHYLANNNNSELRKHTPAKGDIVTLVMRLKFKQNEQDKAIEWIKKIIGKNIGVKPPEPPKGFKFANDWLKGEKNYYVQVPNPIWQSELTPSAKLVWIAIFSRINKEQVYSYAGIRNISSQTNLANATVQRALKELKSAGVLLTKPAEIRNLKNKYPLVSTLNTINLKLRLTIGQNGRQKNLNKSNSQTE